jgi:hypothetical protein
MDAVRSYVQLASGLTQVTRQKAMEAARALLAAAPASDVTTAASVGAQALSGQVSALADELMATGRQNRAQLRELVRAEIEAVLSRWGLSADAELEAALAVSRARVVELEGRLARLEAGRSKSASTTKSAKKTAKKTATKSAAKKTAAKKTAAKKTAAKKAVAKQAPAAQPAATQAAAEQASPTSTSAATAPSTPAGES